MYIIIRFSTKLNNSMYRKLRIFDKTCINHYLIFCKHSSLLKCHSLKCHIQYSDIGRKQTIKYAFDSIYLENTYAKFLCKNS